MNLWGRFSVKKEKANPVPVVKEQLPHGNVFSELMVGQNYLPRLDRALCNINNVMHEEATRGK